MYTYLHTIQFCIAHDVLQRQLYDVNIMAGGARAGVVVLPDVGQLELISPVIGRRRHLQHLGLLLCTCTQSHRLPPLTMHQMISSRKCTVPEYSTAQQSAYMYMYVYSCTLVYSCKLNGLPSCSSRSSKFKSFDLISNTSSGVFGVCDRSSWSSVEGDVGLLAGTCCEWMI